MRYSFRYSMGDMPIAFFKKTAKVLLIESDQGCQIADINFFLVMVADVSDCGFYGLDPVVIRFFSLGKKAGDWKNLQKYLTGKP